MSVTRGLSRVFSDLLTSNHRPRLNGCQPGSSSLASSLGLLPGLILEGIFGVRRWCR